MRFSSSQLDRLIGASLVLGGSYLLAVSVLQLVAPGTFFDEIGPFGTRNDHYIRDGATFGVALAALALVAVFVRSLRLPALVVLAVQFVLHSANHLADISDADPEWLGPADFAGLAIASAALLTLLTLAWREQRGGTK